ncbi:vWA domain-containing protein [Enemella sp. A6]|uniref:vWA domain-containing protein n=1 Tax=Enemella sp. A6 TaxID=3440152 RepID=UPI003EBCAA53
MRMRALLMGLLALAMVVTAGCTTKDPKKTLHIVAGSEQRAVLEQIVEPWCSDNGYTCTWELKGSVDQARLLQTGSTEYDAYWFASSVFSQLGNEKNQLSDVQPMFVTPIVFAGWKSEMERLGFVDKPVGVKEILAAVEDNRTAVWTTNPTQSNSGASVLFSFLNHFAGNGPGQPLTMEQLDSEPVDSGIKRFIQAMDRTPPSTGTMMEECLEAPDRCKTMFTYEDLVIEYNQHLVAEGKEPLYAVYPIGSLAISDAPLGFYDRGGDLGAAKREIFGELQSYLLNDPDAKQKLRDLGRRPVDSIGLTLDNPDQKVFNPDWGIKTDIKEQAITYPSSEVIEAALEHYHMRYRKPTNTVYCLDASGSMTGEGWDGVQEAAAQLFDPELARKNLLQTAPEDSTSVGVFNNGLADFWSVDGNNPDDLRGLQRSVQNWEPGGGTDMYSCLIKAADVLEDEPRKRLIVLMSDGKSKDALKQQALERLRGLDAPVIAIAFADADPEQLEEIAEATGGAYVESANLVEALRKATGYK